MSRPALDLSLYLVTDTGLCGARGVAPTVRAAVRGGVSAVQVRDPHASTRVLLALVREVREVLAGTGVPLIVNDRLDVALAAGAHGVHLGQDDLPPVEARRIAGSGFLIGLSASSADEAAEADKLPPGTVDYLGLSPFAETSTKAEAGAALGRGGIAQLQQATSLPCVAIGGISADNADAVRSTGVDGIAVISAICAAQDPQAAAAALQP